VQGQGSYYRHGRGKRKKRKKRSKKRWTESEKLRDEEKRPQTSSNNSGSRHPRESERGKKGECDGGA
jgi:hypothetical protein